MFVHGNPETSAIWGPLVDALHARGIDDVVLLSPPGFGAPTPDAWGATQVEYRDWLIAELEALPGPIHLVGHDWGALHVYGVLAHRPDLVASWAADCAGALHPDFVWHDSAQIWQTPDTGDKFVAGWVAMSTSDKVARLEPQGVTGEVGRQLAEALDAEMGRCILALYRSAAQPAMSQLGDAVAGAERRPGLVIIPANDHYAGTSEMATQVAARFGARTVTLDGLGHWWMLQDPQRAASALSVSGSTKHT